MGHEEINEQIQSLRTELAAIEGTFDRLKRTHETDRQKAAWDLSTKTQMALTATMILTMRIGRHFDQSQPPHDFSSVISDLKTCWGEAKQSSEAFLNSMTSISEDLIKFHDTQVVPWHQNVETLRSRLTKMLDSSREAFGRENTQLHTLILQCMISKKKLSGLEKKSLEAQQKLDDLNKWLWNSPETRLLQQSFKLVIESLTSEIESAKRTAEAAARAVEEKQAIVAEEEANVKTLASASKAQIDLLTQGAALLDKSTALLEEVKSMRQQVACTKNDRHAAWELAFRLFDRSRRGQVTLPKVDYAQLILQLVEATIKDDDLHLTLANIVKHLAQNDETENGISSITEGHPEGLLKFIQEKLGIPDDEMRKKGLDGTQKYAWRQNIQSSQTRSGEMEARMVKNQEEERSQKKNGEEQKQEDEVVVDESETAGDDSDSEWDKVSVPFKPYGDFDRSSIRIRLNIKNTFPIENAGTPPCREKDGSPVYLASAISPNGGGKQPCKYVPSLQPTGCRVPYGGEELRHQGDYELLPYVPELMEFVAAKDGQLPAGRRGVVGGHEEMGMLYHAIAEVEGLWVPGKTGKHIKGATVAYGDRERHLTSYKILCWKE